MKIGIYIGSFNPPHEGHKKVIDYVLTKKIVDQVLILATPNYWHKTNLAAIKDRINMLKFYEEKNIKVDQKHNKYVYTYKVLRSIKKEYPKDEIFLMIGSDNLKELHKWKNIEEILTNKIIVLKRDKIEKNKYLKKYDSQFIYLYDFKNISISSTQIKNGYSKYLDIRIKNYIIKNNLYKI